MKIGFIGLGKMGSQMVARILNSSNEVAVKDVNIDAVKIMEEKGAKAVSSHKEMVNWFGDSRTIIWLMIPQQFVSKVIDELIPSLPRVSLIIDGGNSNYKNTIENAEKLTQSGISLVDVGTSGGVHGLDNGFSMMVGGDLKDIDEITPILDALAQNNGWGHFGKTGAGHFTKMVHNGIEYGAMQAFAEGYHVLKEGPFDDINLGKLAEVWQHGSINESFLNSQIENMLKHDQELVGVEGVVAESGEAKWTLDTAKESGIPTPVIQTAYDVRINSQNGDINYATKFLAQLRNEFGGHAINIDNKEND